MTADVFSRPAARKAAAFGILAIVLGAIYAGVVAPMIDSAAVARDAQFALQTALDRYAHAAADLPALERKLAELEATPAAAGGYVDAANETLAAATIQSRITAAVAESGGKLQSIEVLRPDSEGALQKIAVRARVSIELAGMQRVLYDLNETSPALFFETLDMARAESALRAAADERARLDVDFTVFGYLRRPG